jgi:hypothetical protein
VAHEPAEGDTIQEGPAKPSRRLRMIGAVADNFARVFVVTVLEDPEFAGEGKSRKRLRNCIIPDFTFDSRCFELALGEPHLGAVG